MGNVLPIPPTGTPIFDSQFQMAEVWKRYFLSLQNLNGTFAPIDAEYYVATANTTLTNDRNLGALSSGYLKITVAAGVATPTSTSTLPAADLSGQVTVTHGGTGANLSGTGGTHQVLQQSSSGGAVTVGQLATTDLSNVASGTFSPVIGGSTSTTGQSYTTQAGFYVRTGGVVQVQGIVTLSAKGTITGNVQLQGLPLTSLTTANAYGCLHLEWFNTATALVYASGEIAPNTTAATVYAATAAAATLSTLAAADIANTTTLVFSGSYLV